MTMNETTKIADTKLTARTKAAIKEHFPYAVTLGDLKQCISDDPKALDCFTPHTADIIMNILDFTDYDGVPAEPPAVQETAPAFDYSALDDDTAQYLRKATARIANSYADIGAVLAEAQERLANNKNGIFQKWCVSLGISRATTYRLIDIHKFRSQMIISSQIGTISGNELEIFDNLPKMLQADISSPSAPAEAVNAVLSGDITTHKDFIAMKKQLEEVQAENEQLTEKNRFLGMDYTHEKERNERMLDELKEFREKSDALALELKEARSEAREVIMTDPKTSEEYLSLKDDYDKIARQIIATTQERDRLKERCNELYHQMQETPAPAEPRVPEPRVLYSGGADIEEIEKFTDELAGSIDAAVITFFRFFKEDYPDEVRDIFRRKAEYIKSRIDNLTVMYLDE